MRRVVGVVVIIGLLVTIGVGLQLRHDVNQSTPEPGFNTAVFLGVNATREAMGLATNPPVAQPQLRQNAIDTAMAPTLTTVPTRTEAPTRTQVPTWTLTPTRTSAPTHTAVPSRTPVPNQATLVYEQVNLALLAAGSKTLTPGPGFETQVFRQVNATLQQLEVATRTPSAAR